MDYFVRVSYDVSRAGALVGCSWELRSTNPLRERLPFGTWQLPPATMPLSSHLHQVALGVAEMFPEQLPLF